MQEPAPPVDSAPDQVALREEVGSSALFSFEGRIDTGMFWRIALLNTIGVILGGFAMATVVPHAGSGSGFWISRAVVYGVGLWLSMATQVKRWHDVGKSGWMAMLHVIPGVNAIAFLYLGFKEGTRGPNEFGDAPLNIKLL